MIAAAVAAIIALGIGLILASTGDDAPSRDVAAGSVADGRVAYEATCAACHGVDLRGTPTGPPFLHPTYAPDHHPDDSFRAAVTRGVMPHHWEFGPMPPQPQVSDGEIESIIAYVRDRQRAAGVTDDPTH